MIAQLEGQARPARGSGWARLGVRLAQLKGQVGQDFRSVSANEAAVEAIVDPKTGDCPHYERQKMQ